MGRRHPRVRRGSPAPQPARGQVRPRVCHRHRADDRAHRRFQPARHPARRGVGAARPPRHRPGRGVHRVGRKGRVPGCPPGHGAGDRRRAQRHRDLRRGRPLPRHRNGSVAHRAHHHVRAHVRGDRAAGHGTAHREGRERVHPSSGTRARRTRSQPARAGPAPSGGAVPRSPEPHLQRCRGPRRSDCVHPWRRARRERCGQHRRERCHQHAARHHRRTARADAVRRAGLVAGAQHQQPRRRAHPPTMSPNCWRRAASPPATRPRTCCGSRRRTAPRR